MLWLEIVALAVVQGIGEFLPISSSGHVVVVAALFNEFGRPLHEIVTVNIVLHVGTLLAIIVFYWRRILRLLGSDRRVIGLLIVGSIPAGVVGCLLRGQCEGMLQSPITAGLMLPLTGLILLWSVRCDSGKLTCCELTYGRALMIGLAQAFAILPGISRSGATIVAGLACGARRDEAAAFSFLLAIPAIAGAGLFEIIELLGKPIGSVSLGMLTVGAMVSFAVGMVSLSWLIRWLDQGRLYLFACWVIPVGLAVLAWKLL